MCVGFGKDGAVHCAQESTAPPGDTVPGGHGSQVPARVRKDPGEQVRAGVAALQYGAAASDVEPGGQGRHDDALLFG